MEKVVKKRNPRNELQISLWRAKEFYKKLCEISPRVEELNQHMVTEADELEFMELKLIRIAFWVALIIEIGRLFDTYDKPKKRVISLKNFFNDSDSIAEINRIHGQMIISQIIKTRNTYTAHISDDFNIPNSVKSICESNLGTLLNDVDTLLSGVKLQV